VKAIGMKPNEAIHWICIPSILFSVLGLLWNIPVFGNRIPGTFSDWLNPATLVVLLAFIYYLRLSPALAFGMLVITFILLFINFSIEKSLGETWKVALIVFVIAWIGQSIGHKIEGKKPSFFKDIQFLLIGPMWLLSFIYKKSGISI
jgi:uncharacterized membrane protein YGL010W